MITINLFVQKATPGSSEQVDSLHPALRLFCHFLTHTVKGSWRLHLVLHFKPRALSGQADQLPALLMAAEAGAFPFWRSVWKDSTAFLADHLQADCIRRPSQESDAHPLSFPLKAGIALLTASKPRSSWTVPLCLLQPWAHPFSPGAHWAPLCVHTPPSAGTVHCLWPAERLCPHPAHPSVSSSRPFSFGAKLRGLNPPQVFRLRIVSSQCLHFIKGKPSCLWNIKWLGQLWEADL